MDDKFISIREFCDCYHIETSFVASLREYGLVQITTIDKDEFIETAQVRDLEKMMRLYYDLDINIEGIDAIRHLLNKVSQLQDHIRILENRLRLYED